ncbi:MAG TPA: YvcK family protein [Candidatus Pacearchaeota archaeon]|nr:YvcK family protein [Candidatus Pacearchaeota archaeon]
MKKIVTIGGGTGQYTLLRGLKNYDIDLTAIVSVLDNGGSSGELRADFGILPPGDLRNCLLALADDSKIGDLKHIFQYRFPEGKLSNHNLGNLILAALNEKYGNMGEAVQAVSKILGIKGRVLPVSVDYANVYAKNSQGKILKGESEINYSPDAKNIESLWIEPDAYIYKEAAEALRQANLIVISPGELYGSILPNFLIKGFIEAIKESKAKVVYVCNLVTKQGTFGFKASDFLKIIETALGKKVDYIVCNTEKPSTKIVDKYQQEESFFVEPDLKGENVITGDFLTEFDVGGFITARHDSDKIARVILSLS